MTNEEAIKRLEKLKAIYFGMDIKSDIDALDMAIKALQENEKLKVEVEKWKSYFEQEIENEC